MYKWLKVGMRTAYVGVSVMLVGLLYGGWSTAWGTVWALPFVGVTLLAVAGIIVGVLVVEWMLRDFE